MTDDKRFDEWNQKKTTLHQKANTPIFKEGEVYWCAFGENIGVEINGKHSMFSRPVLIIKKLSQLGFLGAPLSSQKHKGSWYVSLNFQNKDQVVVLAQIRVLSVHRLYNQMGQVSSHDLALIKEKFHHLFCK